jgi:hypothetical protein
VRMYGMLFNECPWSDDEVTGVRPTEAHFVECVRVFNAPEIELTEADLLPLADEDTARLLLELDPFQVER